MTQDVELTCSLGVMENRFNRRIAQALEATIAPHGPTDTHISSATKRILH